MNTHDKKRRAQSIKALEKAKKCLENERTHLSIQEPAPMNELYRVHDCLDHVENALERLSEEVETGV